jgi:Protein of unknown function (DUF3341)
MNNPPTIYGLLAEFEKPAELLAATRAARTAGYQKMDAYSPYPIEGLAEALGFHRTRLPLMILVGGIIGCLGGFALQYWCAAVNYPVNVGGRPLNSWPLFIPITFELTVLCAALSAVIGLFALNRLPMPYHPVFNVRRFALATRDRFFLCIEATDPIFDLTATRQFLDGLKPKQIEEVLP